MAQERWLLIPQTPTRQSSRADAAGSNSGDTDSSFLVDKALLIRLAAKEEVLEDVTASSSSLIDNTGVEECSMERAAACAR